MNQFIKKLCHKLCHNLFHKSSTYCIQQITLKDKFLLLTTLSTEQKVHINRKINNFCQVNKNRFWIIYYRFSEKKIDFSCQRCNKFELCQAYILKRIIKHIKAFDTQQESTIFKEVREILTLKNKMADNFKKGEKEIIEFYKERVFTNYKEKAFDLQTAMALIENTLLKVEHNDISLIIKQRLQRYQLYQSPIILEAFFIENSQEELILKKTSLLELLTYEQFINYIKKPLESRYIDFLRSSQSIKEVSQEEEESQKIEYKLDSDTIDNLLESLSYKEKILYKLRYGFKLTNQEFLTISEQLKDINEALIQLFTTTEKLYIKFLIHYNLDETSEHFTIFQDKEAIKASISTKLLNYREKFNINSYKGKDSEEIVMKLIYNEPLRAKELGEVLGFTDKEIHKKVENIKKKLKRLGIEQ
jgi:hypothetical protein